MAITISQTPQLYSPANNPVIFAASSNASGFLYFQFEVFKQGDSIPFQTLKLYPSPDNQTGVAVDISNVLKDVVEHEFKNYTTAITDTFTKNILQYYVKFTEKILGSGSVVDGANLSSSTYFAFNGALDKISNKYFTYSNYVANQVANNQIRFLTTQPLTKNITDTTNEGLYFFVATSSTNITARYIFYSSNGTVLKTDNRTITNANRIVRLNTSIARLKVDITPSTVIPNTKYFTVQLFNTSNTAISELRTYNYEPLPCHLDPINIVWVNKYGMLDTYQFVNPVSTLNVERTLIQKNPLAIDGTGKLQEYNGNLFNIVDQILTVNPKQEIKASTRPLTDSEAQWLSGLLTSPQVYLQVTTDLFIPVTVSDSTLTLTPKRFLTELNVYQFTFKLSDGFTPDYMIT